jgi:drug/metabolite transporter (DMT)-like permease
VTEITFSAFTPYIWFSVFYLVVMITFLAYFLTIAALKHLSTATVSYYIYLQPLLVTILALILGKDLPGWHQGAAAALIFGGVYLVNRRQIRAISRSVRRATGVNVKSE